ncbi:TPA: hypothetical protein N0F65_006932 [Lagenidium giganteum]|uniref:Methyltransferase domain-containing protein n=1 Tax=Lagenidium giganteum TaxID=4803 RepID=A0AAV2ZH54_9STRA|nr:TPA: hypothetical protein N0F65_006932 [Lagenidium giganteum]
MEHRRWFHADILKAQQKVVKDGVYSHDNFAFGTTPCYTWHRVLSTDSVNHALRACQLEMKQQRSSHVTVFGSSTGSLVLFTHLLAGVRCVGVEILPHLHHVAESVAQKFQISNCVFVNQDMLTFDVESSRLLVLTSQCWDADLCTSLRQKIEQELVAGAIVVDYQASILESSKHFELVETVEACEVSWHEDLTMFVFRKI